MCVLALAVSGALIAILGSAGGAAGAPRQQLVADSAKLAADSPRQAISPQLSSCAEITGLADLAANPQYPTAIASSTDVPAASGNPEYCDVKGMIAPQTHFELELPVHTWQGRYLQNVCGGYCGTSPNSRSPPAMRC
jgi:feruloyl esterase